jgi:hypothetical protein
MTRFPASQYGAYGDFTAGWYENVGLSILVRRVGLSIRVLIHPMESLRSEALCGTRGAPGHTAHEHDGGFRQLVQMLPSVPPPASQFLLCGPAPTLMGAL